LLCLGLSLISEGLGYDLI